MFFNFVLIYLSIKCFYNIVHLVIKMKNINLNAMKVKDNP